MMITQLALHTFRCFDSFTMKHIMPITLIGGKNNSGKSAILEAVFLAAGYRNPNIYFALAAGRNGNGTLQATPQRIWNPLFYNMDKTDSFSIQLIRNEGLNSTLTMKKVEDNAASLDINADTVTNILKQGYNPTTLNRYFYSLQYTCTVGTEKSIGVFSFENTKINHVSLSKADKEKNPILKVLFYKDIYVPDNATIAEWVSHLILDGDKSILLQLLQIFDKRIVDITTIVDNKIPYVYVILTDKQKLPITYMGDGINKMLQLLLCILTTPQGIVLIDELENGFHYSVYENILHVLYAAALQVKCQLFITTHNIDILRESSHVMKKMNALDKLGYQRIDFTKGKRKAYPFSGEELENALDIEMEVR